MHNHKKDFYTPNILKLKWKTLEGLLRAIFAYILGFVLNILVFQANASIFPFISSLYTIIIVIALISFFHEIPEWNTRFSLGWIAGYFLML